MTAGYEDPTREAMLAEIAHREGDGEKWQQKEPLWVIEKRIYAFLDITKGFDASDDALIHRAATAEQDRQEEVIANRDRKRVIIERETAYRARVNDKVTGLADAIESFVATGDKDRLKEKLFDAFREEDEKLQHQLARIGVHLRPIG